MALRHEMMRMVKRAHALHQLREDDHCEICNKLADEFLLWMPTPDGGERFPYWLSRVVEGVIRDAEENNTDEV